MRNSVSISLPDQIFKQLRLESKKENASNSEIVRKALRQYFIRTEFDRLHRQAILEATKRGITLTEEEIYEQIS